MNILVICTGNSARSILLETILRHHGNSYIRAFSAGSKPAGEVHPEALRLLSRLGYDLAHARSKSWDEFADANGHKMDLVITVCDNAAGETCPFWPGAPIRHHFGIQDPASVKGPAAKNAFRLAYLQLLDFASHLLSLDLENLSPPEIAAALKNFQPSFGVSS